MLHVASVPAEKELRKATFISIVGGNSGRRLSNSTCTRGFIQASFMCAREGMRNVKSACAYYFVGNELPIARYRLHVQRFSGIVFQVAGCRMGIACTFD